MRLLGIGLSIVLLIPCLNAPASSVRAETILIEAESFDDHGGWSLDTQFIDIMGSPYLLAHGLGRPVADAATRVEFSEGGTYRVWVRTKDWVARWRAKGRPGRFQVHVNGEPLEVEFGTEGAEWHWQDGGTVEIAAGEATVALRDLTGFCGRCDAILFTTDRELVPPNLSRPLADWRRELLGLPEEPRDLEPFDLVVVGGGYSGMGAAISAARQGLNVALIQNRPVLGGNGSSEIRVWAMGEVRRGKYPHIGEIVEEFSDDAKASPAPAEQFGDDLKERIVRAEPNISLFLNHHAYRVETEENRVTAVVAFDTRTSEETRFRAPLFVDCTGHGTIGYLAGANYEIKPRERLGMSNMWKWAEADGPVEFPETPWALDLKMDDFPYPVRFHGQWFWESGFDKDPIHDLEYIRDWNLRAVFGAFNAMKNRDGAADHRNAALTWVAFIGGTRESRRLLGDVILTQDDIVTKRDFPDGCVPSTWSIDLHYPNRRYARKYPDNPFIAVAVHDRRVDRDYGYPIPYRCFYSRNIENLFMAGRCISVTQEALGTVRVMKTCGMMGEVVGKAAALCILHDCTPRDIYEQHWDELDALMRMPGITRRDTPDGEFYVRDDAVKLRPAGIAYIDPAELPGLVIDDNQAQLAGQWTRGQGLRNYVGQAYSYANPGSGATATYRFLVDESGRYEIRIAHQPHENRGTQVPVTIRHAGGEEQISMNQRQAPAIDDAFTSLGVFEFDHEVPGKVIIGTDDAGGYVHADAVQILPVEE